MRCLDFSVTLNRLGLLMTGEQGPRGFSVAQSTCSREQVSLGPATMSPGLYFFILKMDALQKYQALGSRTEKQSLALYHFRSHVSVIGVSGLETLGTQQELGRILRQSPEAHTLLPHPVLFG